MPALPVSPRQGNAALSFLNAVRPPQTELHTYLGAESASVDVTFNSLKLQPFNVNQNQTTVLPKPNGMLHVATMGDLAGGTRAGVFVPSPLSHNPFPLQTAGSLAQCQEEIKERDHTLAIAIAAVLGVFMVIALVIYLYRSRQRSGYKALS